MTPRSRLRSNAPQLAAGGLLLALFAAGAAAYPGFASIAVIRNLFVDNAFLGVAAIGATFVILSGGIDLSVGSVMAFTGILVATLVEHAHVHPLIAFAAALAAGIAFGVGQGALIAWFDLPPFLVTLAGLFLARGAAFAVHPQAIGIDDDFVASTINRSLALRLPIGGRGVVLPPTVAVWLALFAASWIVLGHTRFGRAVRTVGDDAAAAALMGLPVAATRVGVYAVSGAFSALAGIVFVLYQQSGDPASCRGLELDAIAAVVIGGTLLRGGVGSLWGTLVGVLTLGLVQTLIAFQGDLSSWWTRIVAGGLVLAFLLLQRVLAPPGR